MGTAYQKVGLNDVKPDNVPIEYMGAGHTPNAAYPPSLYFEAVWHLV